MSRTIGPRGRIAGGVAALRLELAGAPGRLRLVATVAVLAALLGGLLGGHALQRRAAALEDARQAAAHLVLLQRVQTQLVQADADATNGFLAFGVEPQALRADYLTALRGASRDLATAAQAGPDDARVLGEVNAALTRYTGYISSARANNRQQVAVGASYLGAGGAALRTEIIPRLQERVNADAQALDDAFSRAADARLLLLVAALLGLGGLLGAQVWLARRTRRLVNVPAAAATAGLLVALAAGGLTMAAAQSGAEEVRRADLTPAVDLSQARVAAFDAKSQESLGLIVRGSAAGGDTAWAEAYRSAEAALGDTSAAATRSLQAYAQAHERIRALDDANRWRAAVDAAQSAGDGSANTTFDAFDTVSGQQLAASTARVATGLDDAGRLLLPAALLLLLAGVAAAVAAWWGVSLRWEEYR